VLDGRFVELMAEGRVGAVDYLLKCSGGISHKVLAGNGRTVVQARGWLLQPAMGDVTQT